MIEFDAGVLAMPQDPVYPILFALLAERPELTRAQEFLDAAEDSARSLALRSLGDVRATQIQAHRYLAEGGRPELTADSAQIIEALPPRLGDVLELGYGYGLLAPRLRNRASRYIGVDLETGQATALHALDASGLVADVHALPFPDEVFDTVIADNVLEHAARPWAALLEIRRVVRPSGAVYVLIPLDGLSSDFQIRTHLWKADEASIREAARLAGFRIDLLNVLRYAEIGVYGCFPASDGKTCLVRLRPDAPPRT